MDGQEQKKNSNKTTLFVDEHMGVLLGSTI